MGLEQQPHTAGSGRVGLVVTGHPSQQPSLAPPYVYAGTTAGDLYIVEWNWEMIIKMKKEKGGDVRIE